MKRQFDEIKFLRKAIQVDSSEDIEEMRNFLLETLENHGFKPEVDEAGNTLCNRGSGKPHLVLNTHIDTVTPHIEFEETDDKFRGRGSCDAKGPLAALLKSFIESEISGKLTLAVTPDEETTLQASKNLDLDTDAFIVGEPTDLDPCIAARGWTKVDINFKGESAHASEPGNGLNSIKAASEAIISLKDFDKRFEYENDILPEPDLSATIIEGGEAENQVPEQTTVTIDRRIVPPETPEKFAEKMRQHLRENVSSEADIDVTLPTKTEPLSAFETDPDSRIIQIMEQKSGNNSRIFDAATEASRFNESNVVVFGPGKLADEEGGVAHSNREYIEKSKVEEAGEILVKAVEKYLN